jgi:hypothetical protein
MRSKPQASAAPASVPVVLFGLDSAGKPKAARFTDKHAGLAAKAAGQLQLRVLPITAGPLAELASRLPLGRIHANGRGFVPFIKRDLYAKLVQAADAAPGGNGAAKSAAASPTAGAGDAPERPKRGDGRLPPSWDEIAPGDVVVAQDSLEDGWYEAIVVDQHADMLTLRWHDWPQDRRFSRHRLSVALLYPGAPNTAPTAIEAPKQRGSGGSKRVAPEPAPALSQGLPRTWDEIDLGKLVLAQDDGPLRAWWEAIPVERTDDRFTLRWRDYSRVAHVARQRFALALLHPNGKPQN